MAIKGTGTSNDERICILDGVDLASPTTLGEQTPLFDPEMRSFITWYYLMKKWSNDYYMLLKGGCGNVLYTLKML
jgi:hypothetical protein